MPKFSLTSKQQVILRAIADGLHDGSVDTTWLYASAMGDTYTDLSGFARAEELQMKESDLTIFTKLGFISAPEQRSNCVAYHVFEQAILDAVENDFEVPDSDSKTAPVQNINIGNISGSNVNIGLRLEQINQKVDGITSIPEVDKNELSNRIEQLKSELEKLQDTNPKEAQTLTKHLDRVVEDLAEDQPDEASIKVSVEGLKLAAKNLITIAPSVYTLATGFITFVSQLRI